MRKLLILPALLLTALSLAQDMPGPKEMLLGRKVFFALTPQVKEALKLTKEQSTRIQDAFGDALQIDGDRIMLSLQPGMDLDQMEKDAMKVLSAEQSKRMSELFVQRAGGLVLLDDEVAKKLSLTDDQKASVKKLGEEAAGKVMELFHNGADDESAKKGKQLRVEYGKKMEALLTDDQKKGFEALKGDLIKWKDDGSTR